jgi:hypothetical protein
MAIYQPTQTAHGFTASYWRFIGVAIDSTFIANPKGRLTYGLFRDWVASEQEGAQPIETYSIALSPGDVLNYALTPMPETAPADYGHLYGHLAAIAYQVALEEVLSMEPNPNFDSDLPVDPETNPFEIPAYGPLAIGAGAIYWDENSGPYPGT